MNAVEVTAWLILFAVGAWLTALTILVVRCRCAWRREEAARVRLEVDAYAARAIAEGCQVRIGKARVTPAGIYLPGGGFIPPTSVRVSARTVRCALPGCLWGYTTYDPAVSLAVTLDIHRSQVHSHDSRTTPPTEGEAPDGR